MILSNISVTPDPSDADVRNDFIAYFYLICLITSSYSKFLRGIKNTSSIKGQSCSRTKQGKIYLFCFIDTAESKTPNSPSMPDLRNIEVLLVTS